ncbi:MotA/TolQ/ExbB proton channel family protein [Gilvimarinus polysaccharolyticus]|uniref:MotA/TolQ/ExbB proton channel family protein n=1 Tax=Gilvimarinus polysaccharolyticus TaxID=863921 RepID=UPI0006730F58|nr:MotA/TolQ/ExbB proton channel family protein [Gilvimarinus polysaccharolyticus]
MCALLKRLSVVFTFSFLLLTLPIAVVAADIEQQLINDIQASERRLGQTEENIASQSARLTRALTERQAEVQQLRREAAAIQRAADEQTLSLDTLRTRLQRWNDQANYQQNLLMDYFRRSRLVNDADHSSISQQLDVLAGRVESLNNVLQPQWRDGTLTRDSGYVESTKLLTLGPITWYWQEHSEAAGLAKIQSDGVEKNAATVALAFKGDRADSVASLYRDGSAQVAFDPSLDRAALMASVEESPWQHIAKGGIWALPILFFGLLSLTIAIFKTVQFVRLPKMSAISVSRLMLYLQKCHQAKKAPGEALTELRSKVRGAAAEMLDIALTTPVSQYRDDRLFARLLQSRQYLERFLGAIAITAAVAPLLGLLGTVSGMIETFKLMTIFGAGDPAAVSGGISEALVTTELGLIVAIPALVLHALLSRRARHYEAELEKCAIELSKLEVAA